jgi:hypothetical protein
MPGHTSFISLYTHNQRIIMSLGQCGKRLLRDVFLNTKVCLAEDYDLHVLNKQSVRFEFPLEHLNVVPVLFQKNFTPSEWFMIIATSLIVLLLLADAFQSSGGPPLVPPPGGPPVGPPVGPPQVLRESRASG